MGSRKQAASDRNWVAAGAACQEGSALSRLEVFVGWIAVGLGLYMLLDRILGRSQKLPARWRAHLGPATLTLHSLMDGMGIGLAFQIDARAGWLVALAVR